MFLFQFAICIIVHRTHCKYPLYFLLVTRLILSLFSAVIQLEQRLLTIQFSKRLLKRHRREAKTKQINRSIHLDWIRELHTICLFLYRLPVFCLLSLETTVLRVITHLLFFPSKTKWHANDTHIGCCSFFSLCPVLTTYRLFLSIRVIMIVCSKRCNSNTYIYNLKFFIWRITKQKTEKSESASHNATVIGLSSFNYRCVNTLHCYIVRNILNTFHR